MSDDASRPLRVGQFSAYYGDRASAIAELIASDCDILAGDYLAELTMLVLRKNQLRGGVGYAEGFLSQIGDNLGAIAARGIKVITNAGGLDPEACASALRDACASAGLDLTVAAVTGDNQLDRLEHLRDRGVPLEHLDTTETLDISTTQVLTANAYLGAWPIVEALTQGADIVVCPRVTDAALVIGPAAWHFGWKHDEWDKLAGALAAGHVIECGCQATGGNYSLFDRHPDLGLPGMPIAEIESDGSSVITKSAASGGVVDGGTVRAQLLYEVGSPLYHNPDVIADLSSCTVAEIAPNRVRVSDTRGLPPTDNLKLSLSYEGGYRNQVTIGLTGGRISEKEAWLRNQVIDAVGDETQFDSFRWTRIGPMSSDGGTYDESTALVVINARDRSREKVSRAKFSDRITQLGTSSIPGFYTFTPPARERLVGIQWPCLIPKSSVAVEVVIDGKRTPVPWPPAPSESSRRSKRESTVTAVNWSDEPTSTTRLDTLVGTRSGDKAGTANVGVWVDSDEAFDWLRAYLTIETFLKLVPEAAALRVVRHEFPNLNALNFLVHGWLEDGVASCTRIDAQAKGLGEYLGAQHAPIPDKLLANSTSSS